MMPLWDLIPIYSHEIEVHRSQLKY